jgi:RNA polymerase sigma factor (sigma-70 family)
VQMHTTLTMLTDAQTIAASLEEEERFGLIFDRHFAAIHRYLHRRVGKELADDLAADTFTQAFDHRREYDPSRLDARPWLFGIAANLLRHHRRAERRRLFAYARALGDPVSHIDVDAVHSRVDAAAASPLVAVALMTLEHGDREALLLLAWADLTYQQIAEALDIPVGTVRSRIHRARRLVRTSLNGHGLDMAAPTSDEEA